ncbi:hypothetical protein [Pedobacter nyackensis]|uniref:Uncharacterized protein n=1 Tax=Pedobacter nyackensis TaxID=475255 RepID=A0A1W2APS1_9SPHI|nr:hypothetical protein [Pedobacter nyackensis]SMC62685.1 hypothetical protein SAMN04488101_101832 [Pedobacter nyackensis]
MEELNDDELQELLSSGPISGDKTLGKKEAGDLLAYKDLFKALDTEPGQGLPFSFASDVRRKLQERFNRKSDILFNILAVTIFMLSMLLGYGLLQLISQTTADLVLHVVLKFKWVLLLVVCLFFCILGIDQRLAKREY